MSIPPEILELVKQQQARELWGMGEAFAEKWKKRLHDAEVNVLPKSGD
jgi:hypothetical protein